LSSSGWKPGYLGVELACSPPDDLLLDLLLGLAVALLDAAGWRRPSADQPLERQPGDLAAHAIEAESSTAPGVSSMITSTPVRFQGADIAPSRR